MLCYRIMDTRGRCVHSAPNSSTIGSDNTYYHTSVRHTTEIYQKLCMYVTHIATRREEKT